MPKGYDEAVTFTISFNNDRHAAALAEALEKEGLADEVEIIHWDLESEAPKDKIDIVVPGGFSTWKPLASVKGVDCQLIQLPSIGYDGVEEYAPAGIPVANATTVHETATAEHTMALVLAAARDIPRAVTSMEDGWKQWSVHGLADSRVVMVGFGGVGKAIADRLEPFEVELVRVATTARDDDRGHIHSVDELPELLPTADIVIVIVPLTDSTDGMIDDAFLGAMRDGAILVNVARGKVADTDALVAHGDRLQIVVDVMDPEPLPDDHPLWEKATLITPHVAGATNAMWSRMAALMVRQTKTLIAGEEPENIVYRG